MAVSKGRFFLLLVLILLVGLIIAGQLTRRVPDKTVLTLRLSGPVAEEDWPNIQGRFWEGDVTVFRHLLDALERARHDKRIVGLSLEIENVGMNFGKVQELREKLQEFTASGKFCAAYLEDADNRSYYLASACPEIYLTPTSTILMTGLMGHTVFLRGTLDKLNIYPDMYSVAEYKTAKNLFTEKKFTPAHREMVTSLLTNWQKQVIAGIAAGRKLEPAQVEQLVREGPYNAEGAVEKGLVNKLLYYDQYRDLLKQKAGTEELKTLSLQAYRERSSPPSGPAIAIVHGTGAIVTGESGYNPGMGRFMGSTTIAEALRHAREDDAVKAIVFRVDSGGGTAVASEIIRREVILAKEKKPVVVSMSDVAASGGYWVAMSANKIVADPGTITGSIGVVFGKMNVKGLYELLGITNDYVALSPNSTLFYPFENFTPAQREMVLKHMQDIYRTFIKGVSQGRGLTEEEVDRIGKGRVWLGDQAKDLKLVDELGGLEQAVALAKKLAAIPADQAVSYKIYPREKTTWEQFRDWMQVRTASVPPPRAWLDPENFPLAREPFLVMMPFQVNPR